MSGRRHSVAAAALALAGAALGCAVTARLAGHLPPDLPDVSRWERSDGEVEFVDPRRRVQYRLYVDPARPGVYAVTRYRIAHHDPAERLPGDHTDREQLQWHKADRDVRRYECAPVASGGGCAWRELAKDSAEYKQMMPTLLQLYSLHSALLYERERQARRP
jgi:hypothetical protein